MPQAARRRKLVQIVPWAICTSDMRHRPHASDRSLSASTVPSPPLIHDVALITQEGGRGEMARASGRVAPTRPHRKQLIQNVPVSQPFPLYGFHVKSWLDFLLANPN
jgi:hypothetical protein